MKKAKQANVSDFMKSFDLTAGVSQLLSGMFDFKLDYSISQRKLVEFGQIFSRAISMNMIVDLSNSDYSPGLIDGAIEHLKHETRQLLSSFSGRNNVKVIEDYQMKSDWFQFA